MAEFICSDINGNDIIQFLFNDNGTVTGIANAPATGGSTGFGDIPEAPSSTTYPNKRIAAKLLDGQFETQLSAECCRALNFTWDDDTNTCYWSQTCEMEPDFKVVLGSQGNAGSIFQVDENESCVLNVEFDYLFQFNCDDLLACIAENTQYSDVVNTIISEIEDVQSNIDILNQQLTDTEQLLEDLIAQCEEQSGELQDQIDDNQANINNDVNAQQRLSWLPESEEKESKTSGAENKTQKGLNIAEQLQLSLQLLTENCQIQIAILEQQIGILEQQIEELQEELDNLNSQLTIAIETSEDNPNTIVGMLESFDVCWTIELEENRNGGELDSQSSFESVNTLTTVFEKQLFKINSFDNLWEYLRGNKTTGFLFSGGNCEAAVNTVISELGDRCFVVSANTFNSSWLHESYTIADAEVLSAITNKPIKLAFKIKNCECNFSILVDRIELNKQCTKIEKEDIFVSKCPGFELERIPDNKKSWVVSNDPVRREYDLSMRETDYKINHHRLAINSKEVDLNIAPANAVETDVFYYLKDNPCLLAPCVEDPSNSGVTATTFCETTATTFCETTGTTCGDVGFDLNELLTSDLTAATTLNQFNTIINSELINATNRKTLSAYPTLKMLYERYLRSDEICLIPSSKFDYYNMQQFAGLIGDFWIDLVEQVIPSTTIWGATYVYKNTIFDAQKFKYRQYSTLKCLPSTIEFPSPVQGSEETIEVITEDLSLISVENTPECLKPTGATEICVGVYHAQINFGSEFIGSVTILGGEEPNEEGDITIINECDLVIRDISFTFAPTRGTGVASPILEGGTQPFTYSWSITSTQGQFSTWSIVSGTEDDQTLKLIGNSIEPTMGDDICLSLQVTDANGCTYNLSKCYNQSFGSPDIGLDEANGTDVR